MDDQRQQVRRPQLRDDGDTAPIDDLPDPQATGDIAGPEATASGKRTRRRVAAMTAVVAGSGLAVAMIVLGPTAVRILTQKDATLDTPPRVAGLELDTSAQARATAEDLRAVLGAQLPLDRTTSAVYSDPADATRTVLLVGGTGFLGRPSDDLDHLFQLLDDSTGDVVSIRDVDPGHLGGIMRCGTADGADGAMSVCGWADHGSLMLGFFPDRTIDDSATTLRIVRETIQHRD